MLTRLLPFKRWSSPLQRLARTAPPALEQEPLASSDSLSAAWIAQASVSSVRADITPAAQPEASTVAPIPTIQSPRLVQRLSQQSSTLVALGVAGVALALAAYAAHAYAAAIGAGAAAAACLGCMLLLLSLLLWLWRRLLRTTARSLLQTEEEAAVEGSRFLTLHGLKIHHVVHTLPARELARSPHSRGHHASHAPSLLVHLNHGFGASCLTFDLLLESLTISLDNVLDPAIGLSMVAHDRIGFGLTERPTARQPYYGRDFNARVATDLCTAVRRSPTARIVLVGHSLGGVVSTLMALDADIEVAALVLLAPAFVLPASSAPHAVAIRAGATLGACAARFPNLLELLWPVLTLLLQLPVFWRLGLRLMYADPSMLSASTLLRYRWPSQLANAASGILRFVLGDLALLPRQSKSRWALARASVLNRPATQTGGLSDVELIVRLNDLGTPVLLLQGLQDRLVPPENTRRLASLLEHAQLVEIDRCGHMPQEEQPAQAARAITSFLVRRAVCTHAHFAGGS